MSRRGSILENANFNPLTFQYQDKANDLLDEGAKMNEQIGIHKAALKADAKAASQKESNDFISKIGLDHIGDDTADVLFDKQVQGVKQKLMDMQAQGADIQAIRMEAQRTLPQMANAHTALKDKYEKIKTDLPDLTKDFPSADLSAARTLAVKDLLKDSLELDDKGNVQGYKDPTIVPQKDYVSNLRANPDGWYQQSGSVTKGVQALPMTNFNDVIETRNKKGETVKTKYNGQLNAFTQVDQHPVTKEPTGISVKSEPITIGQNPDGTPNTINVLPKNEFDILTDTPQKQMDFRLMFNKHLSDIGVDPKSLDPRAIDISQRAFAKQWLEETKIHGGLLNKEVMDRQPLPPRISVKVDNAQKDVPVIDVYTPIKKMADDNKNKYIIRQSDGKKAYGIVQANLLSDEQRQVIMKQARDADSEGIKSIADIYIQQDGDNLYIIRTEDDTPLTKLTERGSNVQANQPLGVKSKREAVKESEKRPNNKRVGAFDNL